MNSGNAESSAGAYAEANQEATAMSYSAVCRKASAASRLRAARSKPPSFTAARTSAYRSGLVTTATEGWFLAAARTIDGPPMSICSTHSSGEAPEATVSPERVEVDDDQVERLHAQLGELLAVAVQAQVGEDARVHPRVQGLHPAVQALGEAGQLLDLGDGDAGGGDPAGRGPGGDQLHTGLVQPAGQLLKTGLVVDADQRATDGPLVALGGHWITTFRPSMR